MIGYQPEDGASNEELIAWDTLQSLLSTGSPQLSYEPLPGSSNFEALLWDIYQNIGGGGGGGRITSITSDDGSVNITSTGSSRDLSVVGFLPLTGSSEIETGANYGTAARQANLQFDDDQIFITTDNGDFNTVFSVTATQFQLISSDFISGLNAGFVLNPQGFFFVNSTFEGFTLTGGGTDPMAIGVFSKYVGGATQSLAIPDATDLASAITSLNLLLQSQRDYGWIAE